MKTVIKDLTQDAQTKHSPDRMFIGFLWLEVSRLQLLLPLIDAILGFFTP